MGKEYPTLSKNLLQMKFMQKSKDKTNETSKELDTHIDSNLVEVKGGNRFIIEASFGACEALKFGRMSYKGMNLEIERLVKEKQVRQVIEDVEDEQERADRKFAEQYAKYVYSDPLRDKESDNDIPPHKKRRYQRTVN